MPKMDPRAANMAVVVWNGCARDTTMVEDMHVSGAPSTDGGRIARTWVSWLVPDAGRFYVSLLSRSLVALVLVDGCMVLLKNCET